METNLASKDSHWVYANEVRPGTHSHKHTGELIVAVSFCLLSFFFFCGAFSKFELNKTELLFSTSSPPSFDGFITPFLLSSAPMTLISSETNCINEAFDELSLLTDHFLLLVVDFNTITQGN